MDRTLLIRILTIAGLALVLLVPVSMIRDLIAERQARRDEAVNEIAQGWGRRQLLAGPYLAVPYERRWTQTTSEVVDGKTVERRIERRENRVLRLPVDAVEWKARASTSEKARGIYKARLYSANVEARGRLTIRPRFGVDDDAQIRWGLPRLVIGIADPRGIRSLSPLEIDGSRVDLQPGSGDAALAAGVHAALPALDPSSSRTLAFSFSVELAGSESLAIAPLAHDTIVTLDADWPHPSFQGMFLPSRHELRADGFGAHWQVSRYASQGAERLAACESAKPCPALTAQELGVSFIEPVGVYRQLERASKYGFLFIGLVFAAFFLLEILRRLRIHPIQYALVGLALAIFFLLLTALSEHIAFWAAYLIATLACVGLITGYLTRVLNSSRAALAFGSGLASLYAMLYALLRAEDYALLAGAGVLFALLAALMIGTRRVNWYALIGKEVQITPSENKAAI